MEMLLMEGSVLPFAVIYSREKDQNFLNPIQHCAGSISNLYYGG